MKFYELLPWPKSQIEEKSREFLIEVHTTLAQIVDEDRQFDVRVRNSKLASYLGTLNALKSAKRQQLRYFRNKYIAENPKPVTGGVTEWREGVDNHTYETKLLIEHIEGVIESIHTNISTEQSNMKSHGREGQT